MGVGVGGVVDVGLGVGVAPGVGGYATQPQQPPLPPAPRASMTGATGGCRLCVYTFARACVCVVSLRVRVGMFADV